MTEQFKVHSPVIQYLFQNTREYNFSYNLEVFNFNILSS